MFLDKEQILNSHFDPIEVDKVGGGVYLKETTSGLNRNLFIKEYFSIALEYTDSEIKYYTDDELFDKFPNGLPDNFNSPPVLFFNTEEACRLLGV